MTGRHRDLGGGVRGVFPRRSPPPLTMYRRQDSGAHLSSYSVWSWLSFISSPLPMSAVFSNSSQLKYSPFTGHTHGQWHSSSPHPLPAFEKIPLEANSRPGISVCPRSMYSRTSNGSKVKNKREGRGDVIYNGGRKGRKIGGVKEKATGERGKNWRGIRCISKSAEDQYMRVQIGLFVSFV